MANLLYWAGLRVIECLRLRVEDIDFSYNQITVRDGKGAKDPVTMLPLKMKQPLERHLAEIKRLHEMDLHEGFGEVYLPYALDVKYHKANGEWGSQYVFPASRRSVDPRTGAVRMHHLQEQVLQRAVKEAIREAGVVKAAICHLPGK